MNDRRSLLEGDVRRCEASFADDNDADALDMASIAVVEAGDGSDGNDDEVLSPTVEEDEEEYEVVALLVVALGTAAVAAAADDDDDDDDEAGGLRDNGPRFGDARRNGRGGAVGRVPQPLLVRTRPRRHHDPRRPRAPAAGGAGVRVRAWGDSDGDYGPLWLAAAATVAKGRKPPTGAADVISCC